MYHTNPPYEERIFLSDDPLAKTKIDAVGGDDALIL
jgi:hypothetical protein